MVMTNVVTTTNSSLPKNLSKSLEKILEEAHYSGELRLNGRKLKDFSQTSDTQELFLLQLHDTVVADLSRNRFIGVPAELTSFPFLERLHLNHNHIRILPETIMMLQSLKYLDLSRNHLISFPREVCRLPLQTLLLAHNKFITVPEELGKMTALADLDISYNKVINIPSCIGELSRLRDLNMKKNLIRQLPNEITSLKLTKLDISGNRISVLPKEFRKMRSILQLNVDGNPLTSPPSSVCAQGWKYIFKYLEEQANGERGSRNEFGSPPAMLETCNQERMESHVHLGHGLNGFAGSEEDSGNSFALSMNTMGVIATGGTSGKHLSSSNGDQRLKAENVGIALLDHHLTSSAGGRSVNAVHDIPCNLGKLVPSLESHARSLGRIAQSTPLQTYREYKESMRQQRANEAVAVYKSRNYSLSAEDLDTNGMAHSKKIPLVPTTAAVREQTRILMHPLVQKTIPNDNVGIGELQEEHSFTIRRGFERAKEEADLIQELRHQIETRLKMSLPEDLSIGLADGVVLCHLANNIRPRSVASVHVPSSAAPKLPIARSRRNVDNFLEACKRIGIKEDLVCSPSDILEGGRGIKRIAVTVRELLKFHQSENMCGGYSQPEADD